MVLQFPFKHAANFLFESGWLWTEKCAESLLPFIVCSFCDPTQDTMVHLPVVVSCCSLQPFLFPIIGAGDQDPCTAAGKKGKSYRVRHVGSSPSFPFPFSICSSMYVKNKYIFSYRKQQFTRYGSNKFLKDGYISCSCVQMPFILLFIEE